MSASGLEVFDKTTHETNLWLKEIMADIGPDRQLPMLVRGIYFEGWHPAGTPTRERNQEDFLAHVAQGLKGIEPINPETATRAVFRTLAQHVSAGEVEHVKDALPKPVRTLWP